MRRVAAVLALLAAGQVSGVAHAQTSCPDTGLQPAAGTLPRVDDAIVCLINSTRRAQGIPAVARNRHLDGSAAFQSADMVRHHYFAHESAGRPSLLGRIVDHGYFDHALTGLYAENLAVGPVQEATADNVVSAWMASADHRANLLDERLREVGVGAALAAPDPAFYANYSSALYTADFGRRDGTARRRRVRCHRSPAHRSSSSATPPRRFCAHRRRHRSAR